MLWKTFTECNSLGMLILSCKIMCVICRWKIKKLHGYLWTASTMINGQHGKLGLNSKMRKKGSKIDIPRGIISKKSCKFLWQENFPIISLLSCFAINLQWMALFHWKGSGVRNNEWFCNNSALCKFLEAQGKNRVVWLD